MKKRKNDVLAAQTAALYAELLAHYGEQPCFLHHRNAYELLMAVILSAQCTDVMVNRCTPALFEAYPTPEALAAASIDAIETHIRSIGLYHAKARHLSACAQRLCAVYDGIVPQTLEELVTLPGVGRKTANVLLADAFDRPGFAVDTHVKRLTRRLGLTHSEQPAVIEREIVPLLAPEKLGSFSRLLIIHGRRCCRARKPDCAQCPVQTRCAAHVKDEKVKKNAKKV